MLKSYILLIVLAIVAIIANNILPGANYLYVARPEDTASILDFLPKNYFVRLTLMALVITALFFLIYLPWLIMDIKAKKKALATTDNTMDIEINEENEQVLKTEVAEEKTPIKKSNNTKSTTKKNNTTSTKKTTSKKQSK